MNSLAKEFEKKVLAIDNSIEKHQVKSYTAYKVKDTSQKRGLQFIRLYPSKTNINLPFNKIDKKSKKDFDLKDNEHRAGHEFPTKAPSLKNLSTLLLEKKFKDIVKDAFQHTRNKNNL